MSWFSSLGNQISKQYFGGELTQDDRVLSETVDGKTTNYAKLGELASYLDQSAERKYLEQGYLQLGLNKVQAKMFSIIMQQPQATVFIKKKMYTTLVNNFNPDYMDDDDKLFQAAMDILFANKCKQISAYEKLCKIESATEKVGQVDEQLLPIILGLFDTAFATSSIFKNTSQEPGFVTTLRKVKALYNNSNSNFYTTWIEDTLTSILSRYTGGTGVIELTNFTNINTNCGCVGDDHTFNLSIDDPYELMTITALDVDYAISDAINSYNKPTTRIGKQMSDSMIADKISKFNSARGSRKVSPISFKVNQNTVYGKKLITILDSLGQEIPFEYSVSLGGGKVEVPPEYYRGGSVLGEQGLDNKNPAVINEVRYRANELKLFKDIIKAIYTNIALYKFSTSVLDYSLIPEDDISKIKNVRKKMLFYFAGKSLIQPMDQINIYMSSKTKMDDKVLSGIQGAFDGLGLFRNLNNLNTAVNDFKNSWQSTFYPSKNIGLNVERIALGFGEVPPFIWQFIRNLATSENEGTHVFGGVVTRVTANSNAQSNSVSVTGQDNKYFLKIATVNFNPGIENSSGAVYDPLTPYKTKFGSIYNVDQQANLLEINKALIDDNSFRFPAGINAGKEVKSENLYADVAVASGTKVGKILYAPDGLVYKWKEGIGYLTRKNGVNGLYTDFDLGPASVSTDAFANQDVMNSISLLVTSIPYNYYNYYKDGIDSGDLVKTGDAVSRMSKLEFIRNQIQRKNAIWGNFTPFKYLSLDSNSYQNIVEGRIFKLIADQQYIQEAYQNLQTLNAQAPLIDGILSFSPFPSTISTTEKIMTDIKAEYNKTKLTEKIQSFQKALTNANVIGNDVTMSEFDPKYNLGINFNDPKYREYVRKKVNYLTRRMSWSVRTNIDKNFFIVDDNYDKDYDIQTAEVSIKGQNLSMYSNAYADVLQKVRSAANVLGLEFFCDTQGHLRIRSPQYNKMPSSVFSRMLLDGQQNGVMEFPEFVTEFYLNQILSLSKSIASIEDKIRLLSILDGVLIDNLNQENDEKIQNYIKYLNYNTQSKDFAFVSDISKGQIVGLSDAIAAVQVNPELLSNNNSFITLVENLDGTLSQQLNIKSLYSILDRLNAFKQRIENNTPQENVTFAEISNNRIVNDIVYRIKENTGEIFNLQPYMTNLIVSSNNTQEVVFPEIYKTDSYKIQNDIGDFLGKRQRLIKHLHSLTKTAREVLSPTTNKEGQATMLPINTSKSIIPESLEQMIEDEEYYDYGDGSGKRFVIKNYQITSYDISENDPEYNMVTVQGQFSRIGTKEELGAGFENSLPYNGHPLISALAIDYDSWRMYGLKPHPESPVNKPFLTDPLSQCAPFAASLLVKARKNIIKGSVTIYGNEYMQPGDVVYLEQKGLLFYVEGVSHSMRMGSDFTTTLTLSYGHYPGEYIPTQLDIFGKLMYNNGSNSALVSYRGLNYVSGTFLGCVKLDPNSNDIDASLYGKSSGTLYNQAPNQGTIANENNAAINNIIVAAQQAISNNKTTDNTTNYKLEVRYYAFDGIKPSDKVKELAFKIIEIIKGNNKLAIPNVDKESPMTLLDEDISSIPVLIDLSDKNAKSSPSQKAWSIAMNYAKKNVISKNSTDIPKENNAKSSNVDNNNNLKNSSAREKYAIKKALADHVIDFYLVKR